MKKAPNRPIDVSLWDQQSDVVSANPVALDTPERIVQYCRRLGYVDGNVTDIERLIQETPGLTLAYENLDGYDAYIEHTDGEQFRIVINASHPKTRQRFSMAHEYVHFQMHRPEIATMPKGERILHRSEERNSIEYQANSVAAEVLMPEDKFRISVKSHMGNIENIAKDFAVSQLAVRYRAKTLGIPGHGL